MTLALETRGLCKRFGGLLATSDVSLRLEQGARRALIGPNGAGKTTLINLLTGVLAPSAGAVLLGAADVTRMPPERRVAAGLVRTFQINQLFPAFTPLQTVSLAVARRRGVDGRLWRGLAARPELRDESLAILEQFDLAALRHARVSELAYGRQRLVEIAVAIACRPRVLLLDEPAAGVPEGERDDILRGVASLPAEVSVLLIEHDMDLVFRFADRISVLVGGAILTEGTPGEIARDPQVRAVYLGQDAHG